MGVQMMGTVNALAITRAFREAEGDVITETQFPNGYGMSVIRHQYSYGGRAGLFEIAVLNKWGEIMYDTPITDDVLGSVTPEGVGLMALKISQLPAA